MESISLDEIKQGAAMGLRSKGSSIFYSCMVLSVSGDMIMLSNLSSGTPPWTPWAGLN